MRRISSEKAGHLFIEVPVDIRCSLEENGQVESFPSDIQSESECMYRIIGAVDHPVVRSKLAVLVGIDDDKVSSLEWNAEWVSVKGLVFGRLLVTLENTGLTTIFAYNVVSPVIYVWTNRIFAKKRR